jgi:uncharacterized protein YukE
VAGGLSVPGDPEALEELAGRLRYAAQGVGSLGSNTRQFTSGTLTDAEWTGSAADSFSAFGTNLGEGAGAAEGPLTRMASAVENYAGSLRAAQQKAQTFNSIADAAQDDPSGSLISAAEEAGQNATDAISAMQQAGNQAASEVTSASGELQDLFGSGPVRGFISSQPGLGDDLPVGGWTPGDPIPPDFGTEILGNPGAPDLGLPEGDPIPPDLGLPEGDPIPPDLGLPEGDPIPTGLGPEILGNPGSGLLGPLINFNTPGKTGDDEPEDGGSETGDESPLPPSNDTIHSTLRGGAGERDIDPNEVMSNAENVYYDENGNQVYVWEQPDGTSQVTIRDPANGNIVTNQSSTNAWIDKQVDQGRWFSLG